MNILIKGMLDNHRLTYIIHSYFYVPDSFMMDEKIVCWIFWSMTPLINGFNSLAKNFDNQKT
ncbi:hypothetical protein LZF95_23030 [Algoriphagus sp. AGSA1]|uniref:hypothetical protein n=1 Tax=Algoriphagus sp. AGSA1 TaxID=2907213 RepID=UPI001F33297C|nr:hypothetical protein [Algoriphagus sp. AGSA1]MCE7057574.1 hypothetical protein [Algoriphagus sp. AGSA1]